MDEPGRHARTERATRVLICSASPPFGRKLAACLEHDADLTVVGVCHSPEAVLAAVARVRPDLVTMDLELGGAEPTARILRAAPTRVVIVADHDQRHSAAAAAALAAGASAVVSRLAVDLAEPAGISARALRRLIRRVAVTRPRPPTVGSVPAPRARSPRTTVIGICASTGGPPALHAVLARLPADFPIPVLVVQHMTSGFTEGLVRQLDADVPPPVGLAVDGAPLRPGVWFAPDGAHLLLDPSHRLHLDATTVHGSHRPSGDVLLDSLARVAGPAATAVVLTGMGRDGAAGLAAVGAAGGATMAQDEGSSAVWGMPRVATEVGAQRVLHPAAIGDALAALPRARVP